MKTALSHRTKKSIHILFLLTLFSCSNDGITNNTELQEEELGTISDEVPTEGNSGEATYETATGDLGTVFFYDREHIQDHYILVNDIQEATWDWRQGEPPSSDPAYYLRFCKSFSRMGGEMEYLCGDNREVLLGIYQQLVRS